MELLTRIDGFVENCGDSSAISVGTGNGATLSYRALHDRVFAILLNLRDRVDNHDLVFVLANRSPDVACTILACLTLGVPVAIIDPRQGGQRIGDILRQAKAPLGVIDSLGETILARLPESLVNKSMVTVCLKEIDTLRSGASTLNVMSKEMSDDTSVAIILYTSGSTGTPKGVQVSRADLDQRLKTEEHWFSITSKDNILGVLPLNFDVGLTQMLGTFFCGAHHILLNSWLPKDILNAIDQFSVAGLALSPVVWKGLLKVSDQAILWETLNRLRFITLSGGTLHEAELNVIKAKLTSCELIKTYGQTEMFRIGSLRLRENPSKLLSIGRPYPGVHVEIQLADGQPCSANQEGEIVARGAGAMIGYVGAQSSGPSRSWHTGDYGFLDDEGYLYVRGRKDEMVKILDQRVYPDDVANSVGQILECSVSVIAVETAGELGLVAFVALDQSKEGAVEAEVLKLLQRQLPSHLVPRRILYIKDFPCTLSGKIDKIELKNIYHQLL